MRTATGIRSRAIPEARAVLTLETQRARTPAAIPRQAGRQAVRSRVIRVPRALQVGREDRIHRP